MIALHRFGRFGTAAGCQSGASEACSWLSSFVSQAYSPATTSGTSSSVQTWHDSSDDVLLCSRPTGATAAVLAAQGMQQADTAAVASCSGCSIHITDSAGIAQQRRGFFGGATGAAHRTHKDRRLIGFSQQQMFDVVADVDSYKHFVPWCQESRVTKIVDDHNFEADLQVGFRMFCERYTSKVHTEAPKKIISEAADSAVFNHLVFKWEFAPGPTQKTVWTSFAVDYDFKNALYTQTSTLFFDQVVSKMISAFEGRCRELYGQPKGT